MKITIDTVAKTIQVEQQIKINQLLAELEKIMPQGAWKEYDFVPAANGVPPYYPYPLTPPPPPIIQPYYTYGTIYYGTAPAVSSPLCTGTLTSNVLTYNSLEHFLSATHPSVQAAVTFDKSVPNAIAPSVLRAGLGASKN